MVDKQEMLKLKLSGYTYREIAEKFGTTKQNVHAILKKKYNFSEGYQKFIQREQWVDLFKQGKKVKEIAEITQTPYHSVYYFLVKKKKIIPRKRRLV